MSRRAEWIALVVLLAVYFALAGQYALRTPDWQAPDEPAHYNYIAQIADDGALPVLEMGDWQQAYQDALTMSGFRPDLLDRLDTIQYEDHQPPLYYLLQAPVYALTDGDLAALRLFSVLLGAGVVLCAWAVLRVTFPRWPHLALTGAGFVAFLPQHLSILGSVSNDALAELITGLTLLAAVVYLGAAPRRMPPLVLGVLAGLALLTKTTIYFLGGIAVLVVLLRWRRERWTLRVGTAHLAAVIVPALLVGGLWWARNLDTYGGTDAFGLQRHDAITVGQLRTDEYIDVVLGGSERQYLENYVETTFHSFWGQFGWMAVPLPVNVYRVFVLFTLVVLSGAVLFAWRQGWPRTLSAAQRDALIVCAVVVALVVAAYILYNRDFVQFQGRYLYPALIPLALLVALGLGGWIAPFERQFPVLVWLPVAVMFLLALFAWYALDRYLVPALPAW